VLDAGERSLEMKARELFGAGGPVALGSLDEAHRAKRAPPKRRIRRHDGAKHDPFRIAPRAPAHDRAHDESRPDDEQRGAGRDPRRGRPEACQVREREHRSDADRHPRAARRRIDLVPPHLREAKENREPSGIDGPHRVRGCSRCFFRRLAHATWNSASIPGCPSLQGRQGLLCSVGHG